MPLFRFRLEDPDSGHFRQGTIEYDTIEGARDELERREVERAVPYESGQIRELEERLQQMGWDNLNSRERARISLHRQVKPYQLVSLEPL